MSSGAQEAALSKRRIWGLAVALAVALLVLLALLVQRRTAWPDDPGRLERRWQDVRAWAELEPWSWDAQLAALVDGLAEADESLDDARWEAAVADLVAWHAADPGGGRWRGPLDDPEVLRTRELGLRAIDSEAPEALAAALRLGARLRREGVAVHLAVGVELAGRGLERAREAGPAGLEEHRPALERWRPRREEVFAALAREAVGTVEQLERLSTDLSPVDEPGLLERWRRRAAGREAAVAQDVAHRWLEHLRAVRDDLPRLAERARAGPPRTEVWHALPVEALVPVNLAPLVGSCVEVIADYDRTLGPG